MQLGALVVAFHLASFALVAPMFVLCQDGSNHTAVESAIALCCAPGNAESGDVPDPRTSAGIAEDDCAGPCIDTPLLTSTDATSPRCVASASRAVALVPPVALARCPAPVFADIDAGLPSAVSYLNLSRSTVLRI